MKLFYPKKHPILGSTSYLRSFILFCVLIANASIAIAQSEDVMFQAFDWNVQQQPAGTNWYQVLSQNRTTIIDSGVDIVWMPPPSDSGAPQGYLPRELYNFNSAYGTESELRTFINQMHQSDVKVISDIVINHRVGTTDAVTFTNPAWPTFYITNDDEGRQFVNGNVEFSINNDYSPGFALKSDGSGGGFAAARDIDHKNPAVREEIKDWLLFLKNDIGFDGWRYDFVHGYDPIYNKEYNDATQPYFAVGELLESSRTQTNNWVNFTQGSSSAFDFNTKVSLQNALRDNNLSYLRDAQGRPSGMIGINPTKSVTFLDNHDTGLAQQCCGSNYVFPSDEVNLRKGYAYILTHPGNPMVFWTHYFDSSNGVRNAIKSLITARKSARIYDGSTINIVEARQNLYAAYIDGLAGTVAMKIGSGNWSPNGSGWELRSSGQDYAVWVKPLVATSPAAAFDVNFFKPADWNSNINIYMYNVSTNAPLQGTEAWPGQPMSRTGNSNWYNYRITPPAGVNASDLRVIFNDGVRQTADLSRSTTGWYRNGWSNTCPGDCPGNDTNNITYYFKKPITGWGAAAKIYTFNNATNNTLSGTPAWPGADMSRQENTQWYVRTIAVPSNVNSSNISLIFNNGSTIQTVDLQRSSSGWFTITGTNNQGKRTGTWSNNCNGDCPEISTISKSLNINQDIVLSQNPLVGSSQLQFTIQDESPATIIIYDLQGKIILKDSKTYKRGQHSYVINRGAFETSGLYFVKISTGNDSWNTFKLLVK